MQQVKCLQCQRVEFLLHLCSSLAECQALLCRLVAILLLSCEGASVLSPCLLATARAAATPDRRAALAHTSCVQAMNGVAPMQSLGFTIAADLMPPKQVPSLHTLPCSTPVCLRPCLCLTACSCGTARSCLWPRLGLVRRGHACGPSPRRPRPACPCHPRCSRSLGPLPAVDPRRQGIALQGRPGKGKLQNGRIIGIWLSCTFSTVLLCAGNSKAHGGGQAGLAVAEHPGSQAAVRQAYCRPHDPRVHFGRLQHPVLPVLPGQPRLPRCRPGKSCFLPGSNARHQGTALLTGACWLPASEPCCWCCLQSQVIITAGVASLVGQTVVLRGLMRLVGETRLLAIGDIPVLIGLRQHACNEQGSTRALP